MLPELDRLLEEFERLSYDESLFFSFQNEDELDVHIQFRRNQAKHWSIWFPLSEDSSKQNCSRFHFPEVLRAFRVREQSFSEELCGNLLLQASYANEFIRQTKELLGIEAVESSISSTQTFMESLKLAVQSLNLGSESNDSATTDKNSFENSVSDGEATQALSRKRLRIVRNSD
jgi:hypothetical protein